MARVHCDALIRTLGVMTPPFSRPLEGIRSEVLNRQPAEHKMSIGQMALHSFGYMEWFMTGSATEPWVKTAWTCKPATYPLTAEGVAGQIAAGRSAMERVLRGADDVTLEAAWTLPGGKVVKLGYICSRLLHHMMAHGMQMAYVRQIYEKDWSHGGAFGEMATALIAMDYHTTPELAGAESAKVGF